MARRQCSYVKTDGQPCHSPPLKDGDSCLMHSPDRAQEMAEARRLGGLRRRREKVVSGTYDFQGLGSISQIRRLIEVAAVDTLAREKLAELQRGYHSEVIGRE